MAESMQGLKENPQMCGSCPQQISARQSPSWDGCRRISNKGGLVFVDVRDRSGIIQIVCEEGKTDAAVI